MRSVSWRADGSPRRTASRAARNVEETVGARVWLLPLGAPARRLGADKALN